MSVKVVKSLLVAVVVLGAAPVLAQPGTTTPALGGQVDSFSDPDDLLPESDA